MAMRMRCINSTKMWGLIFLHFSAAALLVQGQSTDGFINIDCGIPENTSYTDAVNGMTYVSDAQFVDTGINYNVWSGYVRIDLAQRYRTLRSFPEGARNCYTFKSITPGFKYLIRAVFLYGNYDSKNKLVQFELHLGVNLWKTINVTDPTQYYFTETVTEATTDWISVCLVNTGLGTPFISGLDLRPMKASLYPMANASRSLVSLQRFNMGGTTDIRFPVDPYDRIWFSNDTIPSWNNTTTNSSVQNLANDLFEVPSIVMQTAVYPVNSTKLELSWTTQPGDLNEFYAVMHFSELQPLSRNASRRFFINLNEALLNDAKPFTPDYLSSDAVYNTNPSTGYGQYNISLVMTRDSSLPPILNAIEVFSTMRNTNMASDNGDVAAMMAIKEWYHMKNWMGDPCAPKAYTWDGLNCSFNASGIPRITMVNLSHSGLTGEITTSFANLSAIHSLDLSHNNLTGPIPADLAYLPSLKLLDLTNNQLNGSVPSALLTKSQNGLITLRIGSNPNICFDVTSCEVKPRARQTRKHSIRTIIIACMVPPVIVFFVVVIIICMLRKKQASPRRTTERLQNEGMLHVESRKFTYMELEKITRNFERTLGQGGFGTVYYGHLEDGTEVAVKMLSRTSSQGTKEFLTEVQHLSRVHHKNLVSMVGYCKDGDHLALVYEFMSQGNLREHLSGAHSATPLSWRQRLQIALGAAQGLEYLHTACKPPLIHRDVKSVNILLNERLETKISDFGLSRAFHSDGHSHVSTKVVGTMGYLDPEYYIKNQLSQKSDVYSFGVVLLELITGQPPIVGDAEGSHVIEWVRQRLNRGNIEDVVDTRLQQYDINSSWKVANVALECAAQSSQRRPAMTEVVMQLKESLALYIAGNESQNQHTQSGNPYSMSSETSQIDAYEIQEAGNFSISDAPSAR